MIKLPEDFPKKALVLAGGKGTRLRPITHEIPKPMVPVKGKPILEYIVRHFREYGIRQLYICVSEESGPVIQDYFGDGSRFDVGIKYIYEKEALGTGGAIMHSSRFFDSSFFVSTGDNLFDTDLISLFRVHKKNNALGTVSLFSVKDVSGFGVVRMGGERIIEFVEKPKTEEAPSKLINSGLYLFGMEIFNHLLDGKHSLEAEVFPMLAKEGGLFGCECTKNWFPADTVERWQAAIDGWRQTWEEEKEERVSVVASKIVDENFLREFLESFTKQSKRAFELLVFYGRKNKKALEVIGEYKLQIPNLIAVSFEGRNNSEIINELVRRTRGNIILCTHTDCILDKEWLKCMGGAFSNTDIDVAYGGYKPLSKNSFEFFEGEILCPSFKKKFYASNISGRSIGFRKGVWERVGGIPKTKGEEGEDTMFNIKLLEFGFKYFYVKDALVLWRMKPTLGEFAAQLFRWGVVDVKNKSIFRLWKNLLGIGWILVGIISLLASLFLPFGFIFSNLIFGFAGIFLFSVVFYLFLGGVLIGFRTRRVGGFFWGVVLLFIKRVSYFLGILVGIFI